MNYIATAAAPSSFLRRTGVLFWLLMAALAVWKPPAARARSTADIPVLSWQKRSDWIDVTADVTPAAAGNGIADDTAAIQAALDKIATNNIRGATVYLPPGTYKISKRLTPPGNRINEGFSLIGHGRDTVLQWYGAPGGTMFWTNTGIPQCRYMGVTWDGRGVAAVGFEHNVLDGAGYFETEVRHQHEAFRNFTEAGIRVGKDHAKATAEVIYDNCLFEDSGAGVALWQDNVLDHTFRNCEFRRCATGIYAGRGTNFYADQCHFEQNTSYDIFSAAELGSSVRRCSSTGSRQFIDQQAYLSPLTIQDCRVDGWTRPDGAIVTWGAGPTVIFDTVFTNPPTPHAPLNVQGDLRARRIFSSNNTSAATTEFVTSSGHPYRAANTFNIGGSGGELTSAGQSFLKSSVRMPGKIFDATAYGANGTDNIDDTTAIQAAIDAARAAGHNAMAYLPSGTYLISDTLKVTGSNYYIGGSGFETALRWNGAAGGTMMSVQGTSRVTLDSISFWNPNSANTNEGINILQTGTGGSTSMTYDRVRVFGIYQKQPTSKGLRLKDLGSGDQVLVNEMEGNIRITDSAAATILMRAAYEGTLLVEGTSPARTGFIGGNVRLATVTDPGLWVKDNHSVVMSDFYTESAEHFVRLEGDPALPPGRVTLQGAKAELVEPLNNLAEINNYQGEFFMGPYEFYANNPRHRFTQTTTGKPSAFELTIWGSMFADADPDFQMKSGEFRAVIGNARSNDTVTPQITDVVPANTLARLANALADLRRLGQINMTMPGRDAAPSGPVSSAANPSALSEPGRN